MSPDDNGYGIGRIAKERRQSKEVFAIGLEAEQVRLRGTGGNTAKDDTFAGLLLCDDFKPCLKVFLISALGLGVPWQTTQ